MFLMIVRESLHDSDSTPNICLQSLVKLLKGFQRLLRLTDPITFVRD